MTDERYRHRAFAAAFPSFRVAGITMMLLLALAVPAGTTGVDSDDADNVPSSSPSHEDALLVTQPVAAGIDRVVADGAGHEFGGGRIREVEVGPDGTVWIAQGRRIIALGEHGAVEPRSASWRALPRHLRVTPSGVLWAVEDGGSPIALEGSTWSDRSDGILSVGKSLGILDDGSVWRVARMADGWNSIVGLTDAGWDPAAATGLEALLGNREARFGFSRTPDGTIWLGVDHGDRPSGMAVFDGGEWRPAGPLGPIVAPRVLGLATGPDGSLWVLTDLNAQARGGRPPVYALLRYDGDVWLVYGAEAGMPQDESGLRNGWSPVLPTPIVVGRDGTVWFSIDRIGLSSFDGSEFHRVEAPGLQLGALDLDIGPDGVLWIASRRGALYTIPASPLPYDADA